MSKKVPAVELAQARCYLMSNPSIVVQIIFDKLLNIFVRATPVLRSNAVEPFLQFRSKVHFHGL